MPKVSDEEAAALEGRVGRANDRQVGGDHYRKRVIQPWDFAAANDLDFFQGTIVKYVVRYKDKGGVTDLEKARHFLDKYIEVVRNREQAGGRPSC